jgi:hypothetical protein
MIRKQTKLLSRWRRNIYEFNGYLKLLKGSTSEPSPEDDQSETFLAGLHPIRYITYTSEMIAKNKKKDLSKMQEELLRLEASFVKIQDEERDPQVALITTATSSFIGKRDRNNFENGQSLSIQSNTNSACPNCGKQGHRGNNCPEPTGA